MISLTSVLLLVSVLALLLSTGAALAVALLWVRCRSNSAEKLSQRLSEAESLIEKLSADFKNMRAARNMRAHRERQLSEESLDPPTNGNGDAADATRRDLNRRLATGELKPRGIP